MKQKYVIKAEYHPERNYWTGLSIHQGVKGTHKTYNVVYNGICDNIHFSTELEAIADAEKAMNKYKATLR